MKISVLLIVLCSFTYSGFCQKAVLSYMYYGVEQGLSTSEVYWVLQDKDGYMWFSTDAGVSKFDGYEFKNFTSKEGLTDHTVFHLSEDDFGRVWYLPFNNEIGYIKNDSVFAYKYSKSLSLALEQSSSIANISIDSANNLKFILKDRSYGMVDSVGNITLQKTTPDSVNHLIRESANDTYFLRFLKSEETNETNTVLFDNISNTQNNINCLYSTFYADCRIDNDTYLFSIGNHFFYKNNSSISTVIHNGVIIGITLDANNKLWIQIFGKGVQVFDSIDAFLEGESPVFHFFENQTVSHILHGKLNDIWITTENQGVYYYPNNNLIVYTLEGVESRNRISALTKSINNEIFYANRIGEIYKIDSNNRHVLLDSGYVDITNLSFDLNNTLLVSSFHYLKSKIPIVTISEFQARTFLYTKKGDLWVVNRDGVLKIINEQVVFSSKENRSNLFIHSVFEDDKGQIWIGANEGLFLFDETKLVSINYAFSYGVKISAINQFIDGRIIVATATSGIFLLDKKEGYYKAECVGFENYFVKNIYRDDKNTFWLSTNKGVITVRLEQSNAYSIRTISKVNGLPSDQINKIVTVGDIVYVGTNKGLAVFNRDNVSENNVQPKLYLNKISVNEKTVKLDSSNQFGFRENYLEFSYSALSYKNAGDVQYAYKLEGIDVKWEYTKSRKVRYPSLQPGEYIFKVKAANEDGVWGDYIAANFTIKPPFWKTTYFLLLSALFFLGIGFFVNRKLIKIRKNKLRNSNELEQNKRKLIEAELKALRAQMNPHFTFNTLNSIQYFISKFDQEKAHKYISDFSLLLRKVLENSRYTTITIEEELEMLQLYLDLENLRFDGSIEYVFIIDEKLDCSFQKIPSMVIQPFAENAVKHGLSGKRKGDKRLTIEMVQENNQILCVIEDTGIGRKQAAINRIRKGLNHDSLGMKITDERLQLFNGNKKEDLSFKVIDLFDHEGNSKGTRVEILFNLVYEI